MEWWNPNSQAKVVSDNYSGHDGIMTYSKYVWDSCRSYHSGLVLWLSSRSCVLEFPGSIPSQGNCVASLGKTFNRDCLSSTQAVTMSTCEGSGGYVNV